MRRQRENFRKGYVVVKKYFVLCVVFLSVCVAVANGSDMQTAIREADKKLKANGFLLTDEIDEIYDKEQTPDVLKQLTPEQQKSIVAELGQAKEINAQKSSKMGLSIKDTLEQSFYQDGVLANMMLKSRREIAKKYGIKAGDISMIEINVMFPN